MEGQSCRVSPAHQRYACLMRLEVRKDPAPRGCAGVWWKGWLSLGGEHHPVPLPWEEEHHPVAQKRSCLIEWEKAETLKSFLILAFSKSWRLNLHLVIWFPYTLSSCVLLGLLWGNYSAVMPFLGGISPDWLYNFFWWVFVTLKHKQCYQLLIYLREIILMKFWFVLHTFAIDKGFMLWS